MDARTEIFTFLGLTLSTASCLTFCLGGLAGLDHDGFEDAVRPTESDPIQPCFVADGGHGPSRTAADLRRLGIRFGKNDDVD